MCFNYSPIGISSLEHVFLNLALQQKCLLIIHQLLFGIWKLRVTVDFPFLFRKQTECSILLIHSMQTNHKSIICNFNRFFLQYIVVDVAHKICRLFHLRTGLFLGQRKYNESLRYLFCCGAECIWKNCYQLNLRATITKSLFIYHLRLTSPHLFCLVTYKLITEAASRLCRLHCPTGITHFCIMRVCFVLFRFSEGS